MGSIQLVLTNRKSCDSRAELENFASSLMAQDAIALDDEISNPLVFPEMDVRSTNTRGSYV